MFAVDDDGRCTRVAGADVDYENQSEFTLSFLESVAIGQGKNPSLLEWALSRPCRTPDEVRARGSRVLSERPLGPGRRALVCPSIGPHKSHHHEPMVMGVRCLVFVS